MLQRKATFTVKCNAFPLLLPFYHFRPDLGWIINPVALLPGLVWSLSMYLCTCHPLVFKQPQWHNQEQKAPQIQLVQIVSYDQSFATGDWAFSLNPSATSIIDTVSPTPRINKVSATKKLAYCLARISFRVREWRILKDLKLCRGLKVLKYLPKLLKEIYP